MYTFFFFLHILVVICLLAVILVQRGRSGGLVEALGGVESIFGTKTSSFFVKATVILAILFFGTSITLAYLSKERGRSLMNRVPASVSPGEKTGQIPAAEEETFPSTTSGTGAPEDTANEVRQHQENSASEAE
ncbi:MAG: preprotein translocase subunit SecG [Candidatus Omnitrophica bacterium]|nr:preprotein translocase subunit SecG [Candidatus Omnitrophota bacterium]